jgi:hypothetical protein
MLGSQKLTSNTISESERDGSTIWLSGVIDENADLTAIEMSGGSRLVDLSGVSRINATGLLRLLRLRLNSCGKINFLVPTEGPVIAFSGMLNDQ